LRERGLVQRDGRAGQGARARRHCEEVYVKAHKFSGSAAKKIEAAGGSAEAREKVRIARVPTPW
jgi:ribosomal protein L18E